jgi:uncharacterized membrane protein YphA (DoxX/SURF4 family)
MRKKILFVVSILFGLLLINSGLNKFFHYLPMPENLPEPMLETFKSFMQIGWLFPLIATVEIIGGVLFMVPKYRALAALMLFPILVGVLLFHSNQAPQGLPMAVIVMGINIWAIVEDWHKFQPLIKEEKKAQTIKV